MGFELVDQATKKPLKLKSVSVDIVIQAFISKTSVTLIFENETDKDVEGELLFPLEEGSTVCNYAVDVNGVLVEGVPCEKEKARKVFEDEVREKKSGPALAEHVAGNVFKTRIYPIRAKSTRTVRVGFLFDLDSSKVGELKYKFPLSTPVVESFSLEAAVATSENCGSPTISANGIFHEGQLPSFRSSQKARTFNLSAQLESVNLEGDLIFTIPNVPTQQYMIEKATPFANQEFEEETPTEIVSADVSEYHFVLCDTIAGDSAAKKSPISSEKNIGLVWDCSFSRAKSKANREKEFSLLESLTRTWQTANVFVFELRETFSEQHTLIRITGSNAAPLISYLKQTACDGGTNFGSAKFQRNLRYGNTDYSIGYYLLFTDGFSSVGSDSPSILESPVYAFSAEEISNSNPLKVVAKRSNGEYFNLYSNSNFSEITQKIGNIPFGFVGTKYADGSATGVTITEVYPQSSTSLKGKSFKVAGKIQISNSTQRRDDLIVEITVCYGFGGNVTQNIKYQIRISEDEGSGLLGRYWALKKLDELQLFPESDDNQQLILQIGKQYNLITPNTSFLVLETLEQYVKHEVTPPDSLLDLKTEYIKIITEKRKQKKDLIEDKIQMVLDFWERRVSWWNTSYEVPQWQPDIVHCVSHRKNWKIDFKDFTNPLYWKPEPTLPPPSSTHIPEEQQSQEEPIIDEDDFDKIKNHPFFANIDFDKLARKEIAPPFIPPVKATNDVSQIDVAFTSERPELLEGTGEGMAEGTGKDYQRNFEGFTFIPENLGTTNNVSQIDAAFTSERAQGSLVESRLDSERDFENFSFSSDFSYSPSQADLPALPAELPLLDLHTNFYGTPPPPPMDQSLPFLDRPSSPTSSSSRGGLLTSIRSSGVKLKKAVAIDPSSSKRSDSPSLVDSLGAILNRRMAIAESDDDEKSGSSDWSDEEEKDKKAPMWKADGESRKSEAKNRFSGFRAMPKAPAKAEMKDKEKPLKKSQTISNVFTPLEHTRGSSAASANMPVSLPATKQAAPLPSSTRSLAAPSPAPTPNYGKLPPPITTPLSSAVPPRPTVTGKIAASTSTSSRFSITQPTSTTTSSLTSQYGSMPAPQLQSMYFQQPPVQQQQQIPAPVMSPLPSDILSGMMGAPVNLGKPLGGGGPAPLPAARGPPPPPGMAPSAPPPVPGLAPRPPPPAPAKKPAAPPAMSAPAAPAFFQSFAEKKKDEASEAPATEQLSRVPSHSRIRGLGEAEDEAPARKGRFARSKSPAPSGRKVMSFARQDSSEEFRAESASASIKMEKKNSKKKVKSKEDESLNLFAGEAEESEGKREKGIERKEQHQSFHLSYLANSNNNNNSLDMDQPSCDEVPQDDLELDYGGLSDYVMEEQSERYESDYGRLPPSDSYMTPHFGSLEGPSGMTSVSSTGTSDESFAQKYQLLQVIGRGSFGKSLFVKETATGIFRTMEIWTVPFNSNKDELIQALDHPFITKIVEAISREKKNVVIMEQTNDGGELCYFLNTRKFDENQAKFYAAEVALAIHHMHEKGIILKVVLPEDIVIRSDGHIQIKVSDLLFERNQFKLPEYLAPEVLKGESPTKAADWWSVGILVYEMMCGLPPFFSNSVDIILNKILTTEPNFPHSTSETAKSFIRELLTKDPAYRLGTKNKVPVIQEAPKRNTPEIKLQPWKPATSFGNELEDGKASASACYDKYLQERESRKDDVWFFIDVAQYLWQQNTKELALRVLTSVAELELENAQLLRNVGYLLEQFGEISLAIQVFRKVKKLRGEEPQSNRDLATVLAKSSIKENMEEAINLLKQVVEKVWHPRFHQIEVTATTESNRILNLMKHSSFAFQNVQNYQTDKRFLSPVDVDIRVVLYWDTDNTNVELLCEEPNGETCFVLNNHSKIGGMVSRDFTGGYGPVEYQIRQAPKGDYKFKVKLMSPSPIEGHSVMACVKIFTDFGRPNSEVEKIAVIPLSKFKEVKEVATVNIP